ncbi:hypothetical protein VTH06DRAFT_3154 [Thermothelomyces fergusii]
MSGGTPQSTLKKRASFRDRLKAWQKPPQPLEIVVEEQKPRFVYTPTHAAADFSRLAVSPLSPSERPFPPDHRRWSPGGVCGREAAESPSTRNPQPGTKHHPNTPTESSIPSENIVARVPVDPQPQAPVPGEAQARGDQDSVPPRSEPLSDYELFIARAEAEDRKWREQILRSILQRAASSSSSRVRPDPHQQFGTAPASSPTGRAVERGAETPVLINLPRSNSNNKNNKDSNSNNKDNKDSNNSNNNNNNPRHHHHHATNSSAKRPDQQRLDQQSPPPPRGTQGSTASASGTPPAAENATSQEQTWLPPPLPPPPGSPRPTVSRGATAGGLVIEKKMAPSSRGTRGQAGLTQRIAEYIKPARTADVR